MGGACGGGELALRCSLDVLVKSKGPIVPGGSSKQLTARVEHGSFVAEFDEMEA